MDEQAPSILLLILPFVVFLAAAITAGVHKLLGEPLGTIISGKLGDFTVNLMLMLVVYGPYMRHAQKANAVADRPEASDERRLPGPANRDRERGGREEDSDDKHRRPRNDPRK